MVLVEEQNKRTNVRMNEMWGRGAKRKAHKWSRLFVDFSSCCSLLFGRLSHKTAHRQTTKRPLKGSAFDVHDDSPQMISFTFLLHFHGSR